MAQVHPLHRTPAKALLLQAIFSCVLILIFGNSRDAFDKLFTYTIFGLWLFYGMTTASVFVLRRTQPDLPRPYRTLGYPWVPAAFVVVAAVFILNIAFNSPMETGLGLLFMAAGLPLYWFWHRRAPTQS
jgi:amino acid transporter